VERIKNSIWGPWTAVIFFEPQWNTAVYFQKADLISGGTTIPAGTPWYCWSGPIGTAQEKGSSWVLGQIPSLDWYKIIWSYKLHQFARFGRQLAAIPFM
jgi:hypothetical protein